MRVNSLIQGKQVETISATASLNDLVNALQTHQVGALVVSSDGQKVDGIVSERDVVRALPGRLHDIATLTVGDIMTSDVVTCSVDTAVSELMNTMTEMRIRHIPVVDANGSLVSIVSIGDIVKAHIADIDVERSALKDYVNS